MRDRTDRHMRLSIRSKLIAFSSSIILLVSGAIFLHSVYQRRQRTLATFERESLKMGAIIAGAIASDLRLLDLRALRLQLENIRKNSDIQHVYVTDRSGAVLAGGGQTNRPREQKLTDQFSQSLLHSGAWTSQVEGKILRVGGPIAALDGTRVGYLQVGFSLEPAGRVIRETTRASLYITTICLGIGVLLSFVFASSFTGPISAAAQASRELSAGKLQTRLPLNRKDELGMLANSINHLAGTLQKRREERGRAEEQLQRHLERMQALRGLDQAVTTTLDLRTVLDLLLEKTDHLLPSISATSVRLVNEESNELEPIACRNLNEEEWKAETARAGRDGLIRVLPESHAPVMVLNAATDPRSLASHFLRKHGLVSFLRVPLMAKSEVLGVLTFFTKEEHPFSDEEVDFLTALAGRAAIAIHNCRLYERSRKQAAELEKVNQDLKKREQIQKLLKELSQDITSLDLDSLLKKLTAKVREFFDIDISDVRITEGGVWQVIGISGIEPDRLQSDSTGTTRGRSGWIIENRRPLLIPDTRQATEIQTGKTIHRLGIRSYAGVPLFSRGGEVIGILRVLGYEPREFTEAEVDILQQMANGAAVAVENAKLYSQIKEQAKALEQSYGALAKKTTDLARSNADLQQFAYVASHDLQEPLRMITSYVQLLARRYRSKLDADADEFIAYAVDGASRMQSLINALLSYSRLETKTKEFVPVDCQAVFERVVINLKPTIEESGATVTSEPLPRVKGDPTQLAQLFQNLIGNGIKFRGQKPPLIQVSADRNESHWLFTVRDNGIGIDPQYAERIFVIFQRLHTKAEYPGTGIGLAICKKVVERHGGAIWVESRVNEGSTFYFTIPI